MNKLYSSSRPLRSAVAITFLLSGLVSASALAQSDGETDQDGSSVTEAPSDYTIQDPIATFNPTIRNSVCVGSDCLSSESFGFDTIRLKENNLQIFFDDTSNSGSFAANDWALIANESANGGRNLFAIRDVTAARNLLTVEAGAPDNAFLLNSSGNLALGLPAGETPVVELHMADGDTPTIRFEQTNQSGFTPQTFDIAANETNFFVRDVTNGSSLIFRIRPGAPADSLFVQNDGNIGLGTSSPAARLHVIGDARIDGSVYQLSSRTVKTDFETVEPQRILDRLSGLDLGAWHYLEGNDEGRHFGPAAEDFHAAFGLGDSDQRISLSDMAGIALGAAQALKQELDERDREIESLNARLERLERALLAGGVGQTES